MKKAQPQTLKNELHPKNSPINTYQKQNLKKVLDISAVELVRAPQH